MYQCDQCDREFSSATGLGNHKRGHSGAAKASRRKAGHTLRERAKPHPCLQCGRVFKSATGLSNHLRVHTGNSKKVGRKISATRIQRGVAKGESNPNFGEKDRPWLEGEHNPLRQWRLENPDFGDRQRGDNNPIHKVAHLYEDPEYVEKITRGIREHTDKVRGSTYEEVYGEEKAAEYKQKLREASPERILKIPTEETWPERQIRAFLDSSGIDFKMQHPMGYCLVDFYIPAAKLVVHADGDYWHGNPEIYPDPTDQQANRKRLDASIDGWLRNRGYHSLRIWESDLKADPVKCYKRIRQVLEESCQAGASTSEQ